MSRQDDIQDNKSFVPAIGGCYLSKHDVTKDILDARCAFVVLALVPGKLKVNPAVDIPEYFIPYSHTFNIYYSSGVQLYPDEHKLKPKKVNFAIGYIVLTTGSQRGQCRVDRQGWVAPYVAQIDKLSPLTIQDYDAAYAAYTAKIEQNKAQYKADLEVLGQVLTESLYRAGMTQRVAAALVAAAPAFLPVLSLAKMVLHANQDAELARAITAFEETHRDRI